MSLDPKRTARAVLTALPALAVLALPGPSATAAVLQDEPAAELPDARKIIDRFLDETGTRKALSQHSSRKATGKVELVGMGMAGTFELLQAKPSSMLMTIELAGVGTIRQGFDGEVAWSTNPMMGPMLIDGGALGQLKLQADFDAALHDPAQFEVTETVGRTEFEGSDCYRVRLVAKPTEDLGEDAEKLRELFEFYAVDTGFMVGTESVTASPMGEMKVKTMLSEYVDLGGMKAPKVAVQDMGVQKMKIVTENVEWDAVPEGAFDLPEEIVALVESSKPAEAAAKAGGK